MSQKSQINIDAYDNQIEQLKNYLLGKKKYNKRFILEIKKELNFDNDYKLFNYLIDNKIFLEKTMGLILIRLVMQRLMKFNKEH